MDLTTSHQLSIYDLGRTASDPSSSRLLSRPLAALSVTTMAIVHSPDSLAPTDGNSSSRCTRAYITLATAIASVRVGGRSYPECAVHVVLGLVQQPPVELPVLHLDRHDRTLHNEPSPVDGSSKDTTSLIEADHPNLIGKSHDTIAAIRVHGFRCPPPPSPPVSPQTLPVRPAHSPRHRVIG
jgi:hypothetical protein